jgi:peptide/nickel transport system substrate-binding protein
MSNTLLKIENLHTCFKTGKTIHLRKGVKFHDGSDLTAQVVKWNLEFMIEHGNGGMIYNPTIECPDDYTVVVTFDEEHIDGIFAIAQVQIYSQKAYEEHGLEWCQNNPIGTGPFVFQKYVTDRQIVFTRNENYWQEGLPYLDGVVVEIITDPSATMVAFANKEIDCVNSNNDQMNQQIESMGYKDVSVPTFADYSTTGITVNNQIPGDPWSNLEVRKAVMIYALNAQELALLGGGPYAIPSPQLFCIKGGLIYNEDLEKEVVYDLEKAKKMLADAGYANGFETDLYTPPNRIDFATALQANLAKVNIKANIIEVSNSDERRADPACPGMFITGAATAYDPILRPITTMISRYSTAIGKTMIYTDEYMDLLDAASAAKSWEEKAELGNNSPIAQQWLTASIEMSTIMVITSTFRIIYATRA